MKVPASPAAQALVTGLAVSGLILALAVIEYVRQNGVAEEWRATWQESVAARFARFDAPSRIAEENDAEEYAELPTEGE